MPACRRSLLLGPGVVLALVAGCSGDGDRAPGDPVTPAEADVLAALLARNAEQGGADFVVTAPYGEGTVLTLTGEVDFDRGVGRAQAVTTFGDGRPDQTRTLFFTADQLWFGDVPGLRETLAAAGLPEAGYVRRPVAQGDQPPLVDALVRLLLNLSAPRADDPADFQGGGYTWAGDRSVDGELTAVYRAESGWSVAVDSSTDLLTQFVTPLAGGPAGEFDVTVTLADHGEREIALPAEEETVAADADPRIAGLVGL